MMRRLKRNVVVFENLEDLVDEASKKFSPNVKLYNIKNLFAYFCVFWLLISILFTLHVLVLWQLQKINHNLFMLLGFRFLAIAANTNRR